jgi:hypothetical protein
MQRDPDPASARPPAADEMSEVPIVSDHDESIQLSDNAVQGTDDLVETLEADCPSVVATQQAVGALIAEFGPLLDADYLSGKTRFRDVLCARFDLSLLESEELCDGLEQAGAIRFVSTEDGVGWHVHTNELPSKPDEAA